MSTGLQNRVARVRTSPGLPNKGTKVKVIYVAGPFRGKNAWEVEKNIRRAEEWSFKLAEKGWMFMCPHTNTRFFDGTQTDKFWLEGTLELMRRCDAVFVCEGYESSSGTLGEIQEAERLGLPVFYHNLHGVPTPDILTDKYNRIAPGRTS